MNSQRKFLKLVDEKIELWLITAFYLYFVIIVVLEVIMRYVFNNSTIIGEETARHAFIFLSWLAASYIAKKRLYIRINMFDDKFSPKMKFYLSMFYNALFLIFCLLTFWYVLPVLKAQAMFGTLSRATQYPMWLPYLAVPIGYALMMFRIVQNIIEDINSFKTGVAPGEVLTEFPEETVI